MNPSARKAWLLHLLVLVVVATCVALGSWQLDRHAQLQARNALLERRLEAEPRPYLEVAGTLDPEAPAGTSRDPRYRPVRARGRFAPEHEVLLRGHALEGQPGYHVLTPLLLEGTEGDRAVLVDRGWVPYRLDEPGQAVFAPPEGIALVEGHLMPEADPPTGPLAVLTPRDPPEGPLERIARPDVTRLAPQMPFALDPFVIEATSLGTGAAPDEALPVVPPPPEPEGGPHLSYAVQWFLFALIAGGGYLVLLRRRAARLR